LGLKIRVCGKDLIPQAFKPANSLILNIKPQEGLQVLLNVISRIQIQISQRN